MWYNVSKWRVCKGGGEKTTHSHPEEEDEDEDDEARQLFQYLRVFQQ